MQRRLPNNFISYIVLLCFLMIGFTGGIFYWKAYVRLPCTSSAVTSVRVKYSFYDHFQYQTMRTCRNDASELFLTIAVISSYERLLIYLPSILNTWLLTATVDIEVVVFIEEKSPTSEESIEKIFYELNKNLHLRINACLFIVKLKHVENAYPPQKKSFYAMKFIHKFYSHRTSWLLRLDDNAYVNIEALVRWLKSINYKQPLYIGQGGAGRRNGSLIHFPPGEYFCMGGSGVILSKSALLQLGPSLDDCLHNETRTPHEDVELGRCILKHVRISCSKASNSKSLFYHHYGPRYSFGNDFTPSIVSQALILHPIKDQHTYQQLYVFYTRRKFDEQHLTVNASLELLKSRKSYRTFLSDLEFPLLQDLLARKLDTRWRFYIDEVLRSYIEKTRMTWYQRSLKWTLIFNKFLYGYYRVISNYGIDITVEVQLNAYLDSVSPTRVGFMQKRFHIRQPFRRKHRLEYREIKLNNEINGNIQKLNIIVVANNKDEALLRFINCFINEVLNHPIRQKYFTLTILYFFQPNQKTNKTIDFIRQLSVRYPTRIHISLTDSNNIAYNRGLGRQLASQLFTNEQLLFFLDADIVFTGQALDNTRHLIIHQLAISSCTVYFPIIFSFYSKRFVKQDKSQVDINDKNGQFSIYGFGNVVVRKKDLDRLGGWETNNHDWGLEDVNLFQRFNDPSSECHTIRAVEPGLKHYYHKKMCNDIVNKVRAKMCIEADAMLIGSHAEMTNYLIKNRRF